MTPTTQASSVTTTRVLHVGTTEPSNSPKAQGQWGTNVESAVNELSVPLDPARVLLERLVGTRGPCGLEHEVRGVVEQLLRSSCDSVTVDSAGNVIGCIRAPSPSHEAPICVLAHMDEISMIIKRIEPDGSLVVRPLGGMEPANFGQGPVDVLADTPFSGALTFGSMHVSRESPSWEIKGIGGNKPVSWEHARVVTGRQPQELSAIGVRAGTRVVIASTRRSITEVGDYLAAHFMDNRAPLTGMLLTASEVRDQRSQLSRDIYFIGTTCEEHVGTPGATFAVRQHPDALILALDVVPVAEEYDLRLTADPVVVAGDKETIYHEEVVNSLLASARAIGVCPRTALLENYRSDSSDIRRIGITPKVGLLGIPTLGTHGYEVIHRESISKLSRLLTEFLIHEG